MKPYRGPIKISCTKPKSCPEKVHKDVQSFCLLCENATLELLDLEGKVLSTKKPKSKKPKKEK